MPRHSICLMKTASLSLIAATGLCLVPGAFAKDTVLLPACQQNNSANQKNNAGKMPAGNERPIDLKGSVKRIEGKRMTSGNERPIDLVICLDTSNSMDGLIGAAKQKIWDIVNELARAKPRPHLRVGLYSYGTPAFGRESGYVHKVLDLSDDLDKVFTELTALRTSGGDEYCARVLSDATNEQSWSDDKKALKIIVDAGNEPATQDPKLNVLEVARAAVARGIIVNTIYCGSPSNSEANGWREVARTADGQFAAIDQDRGTIVISTPFDQKLAELSGSVNTTYVAYGRGGRQGQQQQLAADSLSQQLGAANSAARAVAKVGGQYRNSGWDLVDASNEKDFSLSKFKKEELPAEMQKMTADEQKDYLNKKAAERAGIQKQIADLSAQRAKFIQEELKKSGKSTDKAFDAAMLKALREQAQRKDFAFDTK
jgi:hypothetical protein